MTETQVRAVLKSRMLKAGPDDNPVNGFADGFVGGKVRENSVTGFEGDASLIFDKTSKKLSAITLMLLPLKDASDLEKRTAYTRAKEGLLKKYGSPVERIGCFEESEKCQLIFRVSGQTVDATIWSGPPAIAFIVYEPVSAAKGF
jgi:hypothetical protein